MENLESDAFVFFGATGDLAYEQIFPALQAMITHGHFDMPIIGVAKSAWSLVQLRARAHESLEKHGCVDSRAFTVLSAKLQYVNGDYGSSETFRQLRKALGAASRPLYYLAIPPDLFATVAEGLAHAECDKGARLVVEKPFGRDLSSAQALNRTLRKSFPESAIFRIDHYLGKEPVQNLLYFRFANSFLEPIWNSNYIQSIQVTMAEDFGMRGRGVLYEELGAIRDVVQNHMLEVVALLTMEAPTGREPDALRDEKQRAFRAMRPLSPADIVRGQFRGYRGEKGVARDSQVETFAAVKLYVDTWRWAGVPFYIRAGKQMPVTATEVLVELKRPPQAVFDAVTQSQANYFRFRLSPDVSISLGARAKLPGEAMAGERVEFVVRQSFVDEMTPYERLLGDALRGDPTLFVREAGVEAAWSVVDPILGDVTPVHEYDPNTWGPVEADRIISGDGGWHNPKPIADKAKETTNEGRERSCSANQSCKKETNMKPTQQLHDLGQSLWLDNITRELLTNGTLRRYIDELSITGLTSNPSIFDHAIKNSNFYDDAILQKMKQDKSGEALFFELAIEDLRQAADLFRPIYDRTNGIDGWVSLEVSPMLAYDTPGTIAEVKQLSARAERPNLFVKIPGTPEGVPAIEECIFAGVPVNVTLLFSHEQYQAAAEAYLRGIERRIQAGLNPDVCSLASVFISRWDKATMGKVPGELRNELGIAVAKRTYKAYRQLLDSERWLRLANTGARPQRLLWASTGTKDPTASDVLYIKALFAPFTVNTIPDKTLTAFADHGSVGEPMAADGGDAEEMIGKFAKAGIDYDKLGTDLQREAAESFVKDWNELLASIASKSAAFKATG